MAAYDPEAAHVGDWQWQPNVYDAILIKPGETAEYDGKFQPQSIANPDYAAVAERAGILSTDLFGIYGKTNVDDPAPVPNSRLTVAFPEGDQLILCGSVTKLPFARWMIRAVEGVADG
jgi:hypothetical protein